LIKKQIGLLAIIAILVSFMAVTGVASAQASNVQVVFFTSPFCSACQAAQPIVASAAAKYGVAVTTIDVTTDIGKGIATANGISATPTIIVTGAQNARFVGSVTQAQMEAAINAAVGTPKPTVTPTVKPTVTPTVKPTVTPTVKPTVTPTVTPTAQPPIHVVTATPTPTSTVPEFAVLGLGAPALVIGAIYLFLRRR
jgi:thiol-disulfide isomerase/thioredoxin